MSDRARRGQRLASWVATAALVCLSTPPLAATPARGERGSRISDAESASEYWDIVARFEPDYSLFVRFLITNEGPGERTAVATWHLVDPTGKLVSFRNGRRQGRWTLSPDGDRIRIGSSIFDRTADRHRLEYDSKKRGISVQFEYSGAGPGAWIDEPGHGSYSIDLLDMGTPVNGTIWLDGMSAPVRVSGTIAIVHTWMQQSEADIALRRIEFASVGEGPSIYLSDLTTPSGNRHRWLVVERDGVPIYRSTDFDLELAGGPASNAGYPTPKVLRVRTPELEATIDSGPNLVESDPLEDIPQPFRFLLSFKMRPHRVWKHASFELKLRDDPDLPPTALRGSGVTTITFLNPLPPVMSSVAAGSRGA